MQHSGHGRRSPVASAKRRQVRISCIFVNFLYLLTFFVVSPNQKGRRGYPLHIATRGGDISTVRALLDQPGLLVNIADAATGETALHIACRAGHENIAFLLIGKPLPRGFGVKLDHVNSFRLRSTNRAKR
jgi:hypothetical protein